MPNMPRGPRGESHASAGYREAVQAAARDALATIEARRRGEIRDLRACQLLVNDEYLREIVPFELLRGLIGVESQCDAPDEGGAALHEPGDLAELRAHEDGYLESEHESVGRDCDALAAHLDRWRRDNPPPTGGD